jgi:16S rRNA (cytosine967-C5)-methyltransferase
MSKPTVRTLAAQINYDVIYKKVNLTAAFKQRLSKDQAQELISAVKALCFTTIRNYILLEDMWLQFVDKKPKDKMVRVILSQGLAEHKYLSKPDHVVVNEAINTAKKLNKRWASGLINSSLRKTLSATDFKPTSESAIFSHPQWMVDKIKEDWPNNWQSVLLANNQKPPLWVRALCKLPQKIVDVVHPYIDSAYQILAQDITQAEDFTNGLFSVQDASAQMAALIIDPQDNEKILDACAAPGGKTCHLLELNSDIELDAIELFPNRAKKIHENLQRLKLTANVIVADAAQTQDWFNGNQYDKILLDVPCSASGIIRRHPDIKFLRTTDDLLKIDKDQKNLLNNITPTLKKGGKLLYATCSVFKQENSDQIKLFLETHPEYTEIKLNYPFAFNCEFGIQVLTGTEDMDGFYYCYLEKNES